MGIQMNIGDHVSPGAGYVAFPAARRDTVRWARRRARWIARNKPRANPYFSSITAGARTLTALLADNTIWINYHATLADFGVTMGAAGFSKELAIGPRAFRIGRWTVLATLIHELAHCNGAPGGASAVAEQALLACGLGRRSERTTGTDDPRTPFDPNITG